MKTKTQKRQTALENLAKTWSEFVIKPTTESEAQLRRINREGATLVTRIVMGGGIVPNGVPSEWWD